MNAGAVILLAIVASLILVTVITIFLFRLIVTKLGIKELVEQGIILTESGIEFPRFMFLGRGRVNYSNIESVELIPFPESLTLRLRYSPSVVSMPCARWNFRRDTVVIKFKPPCVFQYHLFTPNDPAELVRKLKSRIDNPTAAA